MAETSIDHLMNTTDSNLCKTWTCSTHSAHASSLTRACRKQRCATLHEIPFDSLCDTISATMHATSGSQPINSACHRPCDNSISNKFHPRHDKLSSSWCDTTPTSTDSVTRQCMKTNESGIKTSTITCKIADASGSVTITGWTPFRTVQVIVLVGLSLALVNGANFDDHQSSPVRMTSEGPVMGYLHQLADERGVSERYLGIPFASPALGTLRFQRPSPAAKRASTLVAVKLPPACMQSGQDTSYITDYRPSYDGHMDEDCLYLNIYLPQSPQIQSSTSRRLLPVLVHIHGGSNEVGSSFMFEPDALAVLGNIVVVTVNYRLGALGKSKVVIHVVGLFRYAVLQSGSPLAAWGVLPTLPPGDSKRGPSQHLEAIGCRDTSQKSDTLKCLQTVDVLSIVDAHYQHAPDYYTWSATIDGQFLPDSPANLLSSGLTQPVINAEKVMVGLVEDEGSLTAEAVVKNEMFLEKHGRLPTAQEVSRDRSHVKDPPTLTEADFHFNVDGYKKIPGFQELSAFTYFPWQDPNNKTQVIIALSDYAGDLTFAAPAVQFLEKITSLETTHTFMYVIDHRSTKSRFPSWMDSCSRYHLPIKLRCFLTLSFPSVPGIQQPPEQYDNNQAYISISTEGVSEIFSNNSSSGSNNNITNITSVPTPLPFISIGYRYRARYIQFWNSLLPSFGNHSQKDVSGETRMYRVATLTLAASLIAVTLALVVVSSVLLYFTKKQRKGEVKKKYPVSADSCLL
ncbi:neuroligin 4 [Elysia marginata]|uniref:Neuroligin 4 n=1 Tax=Elysia marginata TaxID=1093978 RepID=A0AAV4FAR5_9GAST|nr:neuroligin 4 [Elysia marginata]